EVITLTNLERGFNNVATVKENSLLTKAAEAKALDMAHEGYFAHVGPDGKEPWAWIKGAGYAYVSAGENLAVRFNESSDVVRAWMASESHRANIIKRSYTEIGVGVAEGTYKGAPATFVVQYFARPSTVPTVTEEAVSTPLAGEVQTPQVLGASAESAAKENIAEIVAGLGNAPSTQAFGVLAGAAALLLVLVGLTFAVNIQVQPVDLLLGGAGVAAVAVTFLILNFSFAAPSGSLLQTASVFDATHAEVEIGEDGAFIEPIGEGIEPLPNKNVESTLNL
ncbi:MAG: CAP domain-containing protein, partial [Patescibacteria group bacterium]|nr:CAP domain-containing protein [Patescibacteria group bacterium]